jgi:hypothetical protein
MTVVQEYELMLTEQKLAEMLNVPMKPIDVMDVVQHQHPSYMPTFLT